MRAQAFAPGITALAALLFSVGTPAVQRESSRGHEALFQRIKAHISAHLSRLPNYTCHETIDRMIRIRGKWKNLDTVRLEVAFAGKEELFAPLGSNRFGEYSIEQIASGGTIGNVAMGSHIDLILSNNVAEVRYAGTSEKDGHKALRYELRVPIEKSDFRVRHNGLQAMAGYDVSLWVDAETLDFVAVGFKVNKIPSYVGVHLIQESMHYKKCAIGRSVFDLPDYSELAATDHLGNYSQNTIKLDGCREFNSESTVTYGLPSLPKTTPERQDH